MSSWSLRLPLRRPGFDRELRIGFHVATYREDGYDDDVLVAASTRAGYLFSATAFLWHVR